MKKCGLFCALLLVVTLSGCLDYSEGDRIGTVVKFSRKGYISKTWEGDMVLGGIITNSDGNAAANVWSFTVDPYARRGEDTKALVAKLQEAQETGKRVKVHYVQEWMTGPFRSATDYFVQSVTPIER